LPALGIFSAALQKIAAEELPSLWLIATNSSLKSNSVLLSKTPDILLEVASNFSCSLERINLSEKLTGLDGRGWRDVYF